MLRIISYIALLILCCTYSVSALVEGLYCGKDNCYDVLGVTRESTKSDIAKAYRSLARKHHPDLHRGDEAKQEAAEKFKAIATAYEILKDEASREDYDYMLDHPDEFFSHYYRYYKRRTAPNVDVRLVVAVCITLISAVQYYSSWEKYETAIKYLTTVPKYRLRAIEIAKEEGMWNENKPKRGRDKAKEKEEEEQTIRKVIENKMDIRGGYAKPQWTDVLWVQLVILPYTIAQYVLWYARWVYRFNIKGEPLGEEEKLYLIKKNLKLSKLQFDALEDETKEEYLDLELWDRTNASEWLKEQEEETKRQLAQSAKYKSYRRYMKNHGPGRLTFED